jgi:hypothetical protein
MTLCWRLANWVAAPKTFTSKLVVCAPLVSSESLTLHWTVVVPMARVDPEAGRQLGVGGVVSSGSVTVGAE